MSNFTPEQLKDILAKTKKKSILRFVSEKILDLLSDSSDQSENEFSRLKISKHPMNQKMKIIEVGDIVSGFKNNDSYVVAKFNGGDSEDWINFTILSNLDPTI